MFDLLNEINIYELLYLSIDEIEMDQYKLTIKKNKVEIQIFLLVSRKYILLVH